MSETDVGSTQPITAVEALEAVRRRPEMFVGPPDDPETTAACVGDLVYEAALRAQPNARVVVSVEDDLEVCIQAEVPLVASSPVWPLYPGWRATPLELYFSALYGSPGNGGRHPAAINGICEWLEAETRGSGAIQRAAWRAGALVRTEHLEASETSDGTTIRARFDRSLGVAPIELQRLESRLADVSVRVPGVRIHLLDRRTGHTSEHVAPGGVRDRIAAHGVGDALVIETADRGESLRLALGWADDDALRIDAWLDGQPVGATGEVGLGITRAITEALIPEVVPAGLDARALHPANAMRGLRVALSIERAGWRDRGQAQKAIEGALRFALPQWISERPALVARLSRQLGVGEDALREVLRAPGFVIMNGIRRA